MRTAVPAGGGGVARPWLVFLALAAITALELAVAGQHGGAGQAARVTALVGLAMAKVTLILFFFMRLRLESRALQLVALVPVVVPPLFAVVLMLDAVFRVRGGP
jgi:caa(3)-type oxidase subunit IV